MRCFIGFFGLTRSLRHTADAIRAGVFEPLDNAGFTILTAGHFNLPELINNPRSDEFGIASDRSESALLGLDLCWVEKQDDAAIAGQLTALHGFPDLFGDNYVSLANLCHQLRSLERVWSLLELLGVTDSDLVMLLRPDLLYLDRLIPELHLAPLLDGHADMIVPGWQGWGGLNDRFAFSTGRAARIYANRFRAMTEACLVQGGMHAERFLGYVAAKNQLRVALTDLRAIRVRANGKIAANDLGMIPSAAPEAAADAQGTTLRVRCEMIDGFPRTSRLNGVHYLPLLERLHRRRQVRRYLEIGTQTGESLKCATGQCVAIDPAFLLDKGAWAAKPGMHLFELTSDDFFAANNPAGILGGPIDLAFIDGMHLSEFVLRDFLNVEKYCSKDSVIVLHDALPQNFEMSERDRRPLARIDRGLAAAWTGDVWRVLPLLRRERPDLCIEVLDCPPTGLVLVSGLDPEIRISAAEIERMVDSLQNGLVTETDFWAFIESQSIIDSKSLIAGWTAPNIKQSVSA